MDLINQARKIPKKPLKDLSIKVTENDHPRFDGDKEEIGLNELI